jgi:hypothetical protein
MKSGMFQAFLVVLGVVLAFAANEWREAQQKASRARVALQSIYEELAANEQAVNGALAYHRERLHLIAGRMEEQGKLELRDFPKGFMRPAQLSDAAWRSASEAGVFSDVSFAEILKLSAIYAAQERYESQASVSGEIIYRTLFEKGYGALIEDPRSLITLLNSTQYLETELAATLASAKRPSSPQPLEG